MKMYKNKLFQFSIVAVIFVIIYLVYNQEDTTLVKKESKAEKLAIDHASKVTWAPVNKAPATNATEQESHCTNDQSYVSSTGYSNDINKQIEAILQEKAQSGYNRDVIEWYIDDINLTVDSEWLKNWLKNPEIDAIDNWYKDNSHYYDEIRRYYESVDNQSADNLLTELVEKTKNRKLLERLSFALYEGIGLQNKEEFDRRLNFLTDHNIPISAEILLIYPADNAIELRDFVARHGINNLDISSTSQESLLEMAAILNKDKVIDFLFNHSDYTPNKKELSKALRFALYSVENTNLSVYKLLFERGARPSLNSKRLVNKLLTKYPAKGLELYLNNATGIYDDGFPFDESIRWQYDELNNLITPLLDKRLYTDSTNSNSCFEEKFGINQNKLTAVESISNELLQRGLSTLEVEQFLNTRTRRDVEAFRMLENKRSRCAGKRIQGKMLKNIPQLLIEGRVKLSDCLANTSFINILNDSYRTYLGDTKINNVLEKIEVEKWSRFALTTKGKEFVLENIDAFVENGLYLGYVDENRKNFFYLSVKYNNIKAANYLLANNAPLDSDEYGWDALDYFLVFIEQYDEKEKWLTLFKRAKWSLRYSHMEKIDYLRKERRRYALVLDGFIKEVSK